MCMCIFILFISKIRIHETLTTFWNWFHSLYTYTLRDKKRKIELYLDFPSLIVNHFNHFHFFFILLSCRKRTWGEGWGGAWPSHSVCCRDNLSHHCNTPCVLDRNLSHHSGGLRFVLPLRLTVETGKWWWFFVAWAASGGGRVGLRRRFKAPISSEARVRIPSFAWSFCAIESQLLWSKQPSVCIGQTVRVPQCLGEVWQGVEPSHSHFCSADLELDCLCNTTAASWAWAASLARPSLSSWRTGSLLVTGSSLIRISHVISKSRGDYFHCFSLFFTFVSLLLFSPESFWLNILKYFCLWN